MPEQDLDRTEVSPGFQQMRREAVPQRVRMDAPVFETGAGRSLLTGRPEHLGGDWQLRRMPPVTGKEPVGGLLPQAAPPGAQLIEQCRTQHDITVLASLAAAYVDDHPFAVDIGDLQPRHFGAPRAGGIESHQQNAMKRRLCRIDQSSNLLLAEDLRKPQHLLRIRCLGDAPASLQHLDVEEAKRS